MTPARLGDLLLESNIIDRTQLEKGLEQRNRTGQPLGEALISLGFVSEENIIEVLAGEFGIQRVRMIDFHPSNELLKLIPKAVAQRYHAIPYSEEENALVVVMKDPFDLLAMDDLRYRIGKEIKPAIATTEEIVRAIQKYYGFSEFNYVAEAPLEISPEEMLQQYNSENSPVVRVVNSVIEQAVKDRASDIHIEPGEKEVRIRFRIDGILREVSRLPSTLLNAVVSRVKIVSGLDIAEKRIPQDGRFEFSINSCQIDIRVSTFPTIYGEKMVLRLLNRNVPLLKLEELGFKNQLWDDIQLLLHKAHGMFLVCGPTGSGKTTTLNALLSELDSTEKNIISFEDPVEYIIEGVNQTSVNPRAGLTFPLGLRSILRQDPDIVMLGEIRDLETAQIAVRAANTGHLLFSTLHTNDAPSALTRLMDMGIEPYLVASSVNGILNQRLVRKICQNCIEKFEVPPYAPERKFLGIDESSKFTAFAGKGCSACSNTGYYGRVAIGEILIISEPVRRMVLQKESATSMMEYLKEEGFITVKENGITKIVEGITTIHEIERCL